MATKGPGKAHRQGVTLLELSQMFPTEEAAVKWCERLLWGEERACGHCGSLDTHAVKSGKPMPYRCRDCKRYFGVKTGTLMASSPLPVRTWVYAIYLDCTSLKGVSSMKLHRDLGVSQKSAWFMQQRIREAFRAEGPMVFLGPVEVDETYIGGLERNKHGKDKQRAGRGPVGKTAVVGAKDRATGQVAARVVERTDKDTLQGFVKGHAAASAKVYTDDASAYDGLANREAVKHSVARVRQGPSSHERGGELLEHAQAGAQGHLSQAEREAPTALRERVRGAAQHPRDGHDLANGARGRGHGRAAAHVPGVDSALRCLPIRALV